MTRAIRSLWIFLKDQRERFDHGIFCIKFEKIKRSKIERSNIERSTIQRSNFQPCTLQSFRSDIIVESPVFKIQHWALCCQSDKFLWVQFHKNTDTFIMNIFYLITCKYLCFTSQNNNHKKWNSVWFNTVFYLGPKNGQHWFWT